MKLPDSAAGTASKDIGSRSKLLHWRTCSLDVLVRTLKGIRRAHLAAAKPSMRNQDAE